MSKDCLSRETNAIFPTIRSRSNFFRNDLSKQKGFHLSAREQHDECSASVSVEIICFEHLYPTKNSTLGYFCRITYSQMHRKLQPWWLFGRWWLCSVLQVEISYPHITSHVLFAKAFRYVPRKGLHKFRFAKLVGKIYIFVVLKKRLLFLMGG